MKKLRIKTITLIILLLCCLFPTTRVEAAPRKSIRLNKKSVTLTVGNSVKLKAKVTGRSKKVKWISSDTSVVSVKKGKITAKNVGIATIYAKANGKTAKCRVTVKTVDLSKYYGKSYKKVKKAFPLMKKAPRGSAYGGYYGFRGIYFLFDSANCNNKLNIDS